MTLKGPIEANFRFRHPEVRGDFYGYSSVWVEEALVGGDVLKMKFKLTDTPSMLAKRPVMWAPSGWVDFKQPPNDPTMGICVRDGADFTVADRWKGVGVTRFMWDHWIEAAAGLGFTRLLVLDGHLSPVDGELLSPGNQARRDRVWKDLVGYPDDPHAKYTVDATGAGSVFGLIRSPFNAHTSRLKVKFLDPDEVAKLAEQPEHNTMPFLGHAW